MIMLLMITLMSIYIFYFRGSKGDIRYRCTRKSVFRISNLKACVVMWFLEGVPCLSILHAVL